MKAETAPDLMARFAVRVRGDGARTMMFAHGFGCDQAMWRYVAPAFETDNRVVLFDFLGAGRADSAAYDPARHASLDGYADDLLDLAHSLDVRDGILVAHSVACMIGVLAANRAPGLFGTLVLICPSPRYIDDEGYVGGFTRTQIDELLEYLDANHMGWSQTMAPMIMGNDDRAELGEELADSFCRVDPDVAKRFARATFLSDNRADLAEVDARVLILQSREDAIAPIEVGDYVHRAIAGSELVILDAVGHCPNLSAPAETVAAIRAFV